jgi:Family of unknown function (DUF6152)
MKTLTGILIVGTVVCLSLPAVLAHHSFAAQYDRSKSVTLTGTVTKIEWMNPHVYFYMDVKGDDGKVTNWACEMGNPAGLYRRGWKKEALKIGGTVVVSGSLAKDGSSLLNASTVTLDGKRLFAGSSGEEGYEGK